MAQKKASRKSSHWALVSVNIPDKHIGYYDSLQWSGEKWTTGIIRYINDVALTLGIPFSPAEWTRRDMPCAGQANGVDCGVFMIGFLLELAQETQLSFVYSGRYGRLTTENRMLL